MTKKATIFEPIGQGETFNEVVNKVLGGRKMDNILSDSDLENILNDSNNKILPVVHFLYEDIPVRMINEDGELWFYVNDLCKSLNIKNPHDTLTRIDEDDLGKTEVIDRLGRKQDINIVNESGMYAIVLQSNKPEAKKFKRWITKEVLPSIRKTGKYEVEKLEKISEDERRVLVRNTLKKNEKNVHSILKEHAGMKDWFEYAIWHNHGYQGLYELNSPYNAAKKVAKMKGINLKEKKDSILNYMNAEELGINIYHITQAEAILKRGKHTPEEAYKITFELGKSIVKEIKDRGNMPPQLIPPVENIKDAERKIKLLEKGKAVVAVDNRIYSHEEIESLTINFNTDITINNIWTIGLFFAFFQNDGIILTSELLEMIPKYYTFTEENQQLSKSTNEPKYIQKIKNIKSNKNNKTNPIYLGLFEDIKDGFKITAKGIEIVKEYIIDKKN